ncbi:glutamate cyclase domain-containing protein [Pelagibius sp.]|uniref:glutamate cyclase domain-containing protein n=1 Tax=Pelagibius sp. TaxID=1931238 RepID=UPI00261569AF|nr:glutamate cyclase domain-containing protein [Pelagibius sp.]
MPEIIGEFADRLVTTELRNRAMNHNIIPQIYDRARAALGGRPLSTLAAEGLHQRVQPGDVVFIVTGAGYPPEMPHGESDGPPGAAVLARALYWGMKAVPVFLTEALHAPPVVASSEAAGVTVRDFDLAKERGLGAALVCPPPDPADYHRWIGETFERYQPKAIVSTERLGPNEKGITHYSTGVTHKDIVNFGPIFDEARRRGVFSIGIGDNGNEIGFGLIHDFMRDFHPYGRDCPCGCGGGVPTVVATDVLFPVSISNWGCYAVAATLAFLLRDIDVFHTPELERRIVMSCLEAGGYEARYCTKRFIVDGAEGETSMAVVQILRDMVRLNLAPPDRGPAH